MYTCTVTVAEHTLKKSSGKSIAPQTNRFCVFLPNQLFVKTLGATGRTGLFCFLLLLKSNNDNFAVISAQM